MFINKREQVLPELPRKRLAVMFTDIAGFTSLMEKNEAKA